MSRYGLVELTEGERGTLVPKVPYDQVEAGRFVDVRYAAGLHERFGIHRRWPRSEIAELRGDAEIDATAVRGESDMTSRRSPLALSVELKAEFTIAIEEMDAELTRPSANVVVVVERSGLPAKVLRWVAQKGGQGRSAIRSRPHARSLTPSCRVPWSRSRRFGTAMAAGAFWTFRPGRSAPESAALSADRPVRARAPCCTCWRVSRRRGPGVSAWPVRTSRTCPRRRGTGSGAAASGCCCRASISSTP